MIPPPTPEDLARDAEQEYELSHPVRVPAGWCSNPELQSWIRLCVAARASVMVSDTKCEWLLAKVEILQERLKKTSVRQVGEMTQILEDCMEAARENERLRAEARKWGTGLCSAHTPPDPECRICNVWLVYDELVDENVAAQVCVLRAAIKLQQAMHQGTVPWYDVSEADVDGWVAAAAERMREREAVK